MKTIEVFVAGKEDLKKKKALVKAAINDWNFQERGKGIMAFVTASDTEELNRNQDAFNERISRADILIVLAEGEIGKGTQKEFAAATGMMNTGGRPKVFVFTRKKNDRGEDYDYSNLDYLMGVLMEGQYRFEYQSDEELVSSVKKRLTSFVDEQKAATETDSKGQLSKEVAVPPRRKWDGMWGWLVALLLCLLLAGVAIYFSRQKEIQRSVVSSTTSSNDSNTILFVGGGSAVNFLKKEVGIDVDTYQNSMMVRLGSGSAWSVLAEDANLVNLSRQDTAVKHTYIPVCLSAGQMDTNMVKSIVDAKTLTKAYIIEWKVGEDPLVVYVNKTLYEERVWPKLKKNRSQFLSGDNLTPKGFAELLKTDSIAVFTTSPNSGTLKMYRDVLKDPSVDSLDRTLLYPKNKKFFLFNESSDKKLVETNKAEGKEVFLGGEYYYWKEIDNRRKKYKEFEIVNSKGDKYKKDIYVYFPVYKYMPPGAGDHKLVVPELIRGEFLEKLKDNKNNKGDKISGELYRALVESRVESPDETAQVWKPVIPITSLKP